MAYFGQQRKDYQNARRAVWRAQILADLGGMCVVCGTTENLEVHHKDPKEKEFHIAAMWTRRSEVQKAEFAKCELRCHKHHVEAHQSPCGTTAAYKRGCRCDACRAVYSEHCRVYRLANLERMRRRNRDWMRADAAKKRLARTSTQT